MSKMTRTSRTPQSLLVMLDGGYKHNDACQCSKEHLRSTKITLAQFPLYTESCRRGCLGCGVVLTLLLIALICVTIFTLLPLSIAIPVGVVMLLFGSCGICMFFSLPQNQHPYVAVEFRCLECSHSFTMLYDGITLEKRERYGFYTKPCKILDTVDTERSYGFIEAAFGEMRDGLDWFYYPGSYSCKEWARDFYRKIC